MKYKYLIYCESLPFRGKAYSRCDKTPIDVIEANTKEEAISIAKLYHTVLENQRLVAVCEARANRIDLKWALEKCNNGFK